LNNQRKLPSALTSLRRIVMNLLVAFTGAYGLSVSGFLLLRTAVGETWKVVSLVNNYVHLLLLPSLLLLPLILILRRPRLALTQAAPVALFLTSYGMMFFPRQSESTAGKTPLSLLSYNLKKDNRTPDAAIGIIRQADADIVALQELTPLLAAAFESQLSDLYPYRAFHPHEGYAGQGILSRYPIDEDSYWRIRLGHQRAVINLGSTSITLYNTHPGHPFVREKGFFDSTARTNEINDLLARLGQESNPVLIAGDFNMTDLTGDYSLVAAHYGDSYREVGMGLGFTFPDFGQPILLARLDYVFHSLDFQAIEARVWPTSGGSDHRPIFVRLALGDDA
jgi:vancomycin resistance protein VanJ